MRRDQAKESLLEDGKQTKQMTRGGINRDGGLGGGQRDGSALPYGLLEENCRV